MILDDLNPALFDALGAAVDVLRRARTEEHVAQVALSGRRYLEQLADVLFPAQEKEHNGRKVGRAEFKNRIWAFIADNARSAAAPPGSNQEKFGVKAMTVRSRSVSRRTMLVGT